MVVHNQYGIGLGTGRGQKLITEANRVEDIIDLSPEEVELTVEPFYFSTLDSLWETVQEDHGVERMTKDFLIAFYSYANATEGVGYNQVMKWAKKRFPKLF